MLPGLLIGKLPVDFFFLAGAGAGVVLFVATGAGVVVGGLGVTTGVRPAAGSVFPSKPPSVTGLGPFLGPMQEVRAIAKTEETIRLRTMAVGLRLGGLYSA